MPYKDKEKQKAHNKIYQRAHYAKKSQYYKDKSAKRQEKISNEFKEFKKNLSCSICGENHPACLDFHHLNPTEKDMSVSTAIRNAWPPDRIKKEIEKCIVLCSNCHRKLHFEQNALKV